MKFHYTPVMWPTVKLCCDYYEFIRNFVANAKTIAIWRTEAWKLHHEHFYFFLFAISNMIQRLRELTHSFFIFSANNVYKYQQLIGLWSSSIILMKINMNATGGHCEKQSVEIYAAIIRADKSSASKCGTQAVWIDRWQPKSLATFSAFCNEFMENYFFLYANFFLLEFSSESVTSLWLWPMRLF